MLLHRCLHARLIPARGRICCEGSLALRFVSDNQQFSEVEARGLSSVPNWLADEGREHAPTAPDVPAGPRKVSPS
jgi:hypothetical protein